MSDEPNKPGAPNEEEFRPIPIPPDDEGLMAECDMETFRAGGKGGQHQNRRESGVRLRHRPTGITAECRNERSQYRNRMTCLIILRRKLERLNHRPARRVRTRVPRSSRVERLFSKKMHASKKGLRRPPSRDD